MRAAFSLSGATRHGAIALAEGLIVAGIIAALLLALSPIYAPARLISGTDQTYAAKGGNGGGGNATTTEYSTITLAGATFARTAPLARGSSVWFDTTVVGLRGTEYPMVYVECYSDVDGRLLYGQLDYPNAEFVLGGGWSPWYDVDPSPSATCYSHLYSYGGKTKGGMDVIRELTDPAAGVLSFRADG